MISRHATLRGAALVTALLAGCSKSGTSPGTASTVPDPDRIVEVSTESIASGQKTLEDLNNPSLEWLYGDLRERLATDAAAHDGKPGPDADYLNGWIDKVRKQLEGRGYHIAPAGDLLPPAATTSATITATGRA